MLRMTMVNVVAVAVLALLASATLASTLGPSEPKPVLPGLVEAEPAVDTAEPLPESPDTGTDEGKPEPAGGEGGFGQARAEEARAFGDCMREHGGAGQGNDACAPLKPAPAHEHAGHPGRGPEGRPEHAGQQGPPEHAGAQGRPEHAGQQGPPEHARQQGRSGGGPPEHAEGPLED